MNLTDLLTEESIVLALDASTKEEAIESLTSALINRGMINDQGAYLQAVLAREESGSTGIGFGVAIPHGKSAGVSAPGLAFARLSQPIDWPSLDGNPVSIVFLIAVPEEQAGNEHLQILSSISRKLIHEEFRTKLQEANSAQEILKAIANS